MRDKIENVEQDCKNILSDEHIIHNMSTLHQNQHTITSLLERVKQLEGGGDVKIGMSKNGGEEIKISGGGDLLLVWFANFCWTVGLIMVTFVLFDRFILN